MISLATPNQEMLQPHLNTRRRIRITRRRPSTPYLNGYLVGLSSSLGMMHCFSDFLPDGFTIFRLKDMVSIRCSEYEINFDRMLQQENLLAGLERKHSIDLKSMETALLSTARQAGIFTVECEELEKDFSDFFVGKLVSLANGRLTFDNFNPLGRWDDKSHHIQEDDITLVHFDSHYVSIFSKYLRGIPASQRQEEV